MGHGAYVSLHVAVCSMHLLHVVLWGNLSRSVLRDPGSGSWIRMPAERLCFQYLHVYTTRRVNKSRWLGPTPQQ